MNMQTLYLLVPLAPLLGARPIPAAAPVTKATWPENVMLMGTVLWG